MEMEGTREKLLIAKTNVRDLRSSMNDTCTQGIAHVTLMKWSVIFWFLQHIS